MSTTRTELYRRVRTALAITLALLVAGSLAITASGPAAADSTGHITGTVTGTGGVALEGISVTAMAYDSATDSLQPAGDASTDGSGFYDVSDLPAGTYRLSFFDPTGTYLTDYYENATNWLTATDIVVAAGATVGDKNAQLDQAVHITGTVTGVGGAPLQGIDVTAYRNDGDGWQRADEGDAYTDGSGHYDLSELPAGTYRLRFADDHDRYLIEFYDNATSLQIATDIVVAAGTTASGKDAQLSPTPKIAATKKPKLTGRATYGSTLKVTTGTWTPAGAKAKIQWYAGGKAIAKATTAKLKLSGATAKKVAGKTITARITVTFPGAQPVKVTLKAPGKVKLPKRR
ncbi:carboxypeptidase-like regulatory domain-containing protein [Nocardioides conyzicola]|uniref:alpha-amylase n=1 Tax=Nocardioides conyzicola TaxID=1651781 RepID=A0ABP8XUT3_9ACTN